MHEQHACRHRFVLVFVSLRLLSLFLLLLLLTRDQIRVRIGRLVSVGVVCVAVGVVYLARVYFRVVVQLFRVEFFARVVTLVLVVVYGLGEGHILRFVTLPSLLLLLLLL